MCEVMRAPFFGYWLFRDLDQDLLAFTQQIRNRGLVAFTTLATIAAALFSISASRLTPASWWPLLLVRRRRCWWRRRRRRRSFKFFFDFDESCLTVLLIETVSRRFYFRRSTPRRFIFAGTATTASTTTRGKLTARWVFHYAGF